MSRLVEFDERSPSRNEGEREASDTPVPSLLTACLRGHFLSRAQLLKAAAAAGIAAVPSIASAQQVGGFRSESFPYFPQTPSGTYTTESVDEIVSNILTWAAFEVTAATLILTTPTIASQIGVSSGLPRSFLAAFDAELQLQYDFWSDLVPSAQPKVTTFTIDPTLVPTASAALAVFEALASARVAMMITAVRELAELGQPTLAKYAAQTQGMYAEERAIARVFQALAGNSVATPPNNKAFETDLFLYTRDAVAVLYGLGFINGKGIAVPYPGRAAAFAAAGSDGSAVIQRTPNNATATVTLAGLGGLTGERT